jgi:hypothetical protein
MLRQLELDSLSACVLVGTTWIGITDSVVYHHSQQVNGSSSRTRSHVPVGCICLKGVILTVTL